MEGSESDPLPTANKLRTLTRPKAKDERRKNEARHADIKWEVADKVEKRIPSLKVPDIKWEPAEDVDEEDQILDFSRGQDTATSNNDHDHLDKDDNQLTAESDYETPIDVMEGAEDIDEDDPDHPPLSRTVSKVAARGKHYNLFAEGYLKKMRGMNPNRWFRLTSTDLSYYIQEQDEKKGQLPTKIITSVISAGAKTIEVISSTPSGTSQKSTVMQLKAPSPEIKAKWLLAFAKAKEVCNAQGNTSWIQSDKPAVAVPCLPGKLSIEGKLDCREKSFKTVWCVLTSQMFGYFKEEAGELLGSVPHNKITEISFFPNDQRMFEIHCKEPLTASGGRSIILRAHTVPSAQRWREVIRAVIPRLMGLNTIEEG
eukprot:m.175192 g.175192  ORF g.175192 m.175192 type:complete len:370 (-) comp15420_c0_seq5:1797-2906(-)